MRLLPLALCFAVLACSGGDEPDDTPVDEEEVVVEVACSAPAGVDASPQTIEATVALINALPEPVTLPCLLESLERPFGVIATAHMGSAQPPEGPDNPRVFLRLDDLWLSVVIQGEGRPLLEFGERRDGGRSLKGELRFPVDRDIDRSAPFTRIDEGTGTKCANCHVGESRDLSIDFAHAYTSQLIDVPADTAIDHADLEALWTACGSDHDSDRCAMLDGLLGHGAVFDTDFGN